MINRIFSDKYVNHGAVVGNVLLLLMYRFAYPFAYILNKLGLSPNQITTQSFVFTILAFFSLVYDEGWRFFCFFWGMAVLLDFCDGTVARMTDKVSKTAFRYDHMSDIFKIYLVVLGACVRNNEILFWLLGSTLIFFYGFLEILTHDLKCIRQKKQTSDSFVASANSPSTKKRIRERFVLIGYLLEKFPLIMESIIVIYGSVRAVLFTFNGHTLLFFFLFPIGGLVTKTVLTYLIFLTMAGSFSCINQLRHITR
jgi:phosphatidylglycerophosphate synthase